MGKQVIYCEIAYANTLACFPVKNNQDFKQKLSELQKHYDNVEVWYVEFDNGEEINGVLDETDLEAIV